MSTQYNRVNYVYTVEKSELCLHRRTGWIISTDL